MSEPLRTNPADPDAAPADVAAADRTAPDHGRLSEAERAARIEELLLSGLDQVLRRPLRTSHQHLDACRVSRARARPSARVHRAGPRRPGRAAARIGGAPARGDCGLPWGRSRQGSRPADARLDVGGPNETALVFLQRVSRASTAVAPARVTSRPRRRTRTTRGPARADAGGGWTWSIVASVVVSAAIVVGALAVRSWIVDLPVAAPTAVAIGEPLPVIRGSDLRLARARDLEARGQARAALRMLAEVDMADPLRGEADRLTSDIQRRLLGLATAGAAGCRPQPGTRR